MSTPAGMSPGVRARGGVIVGFGVENNPLFDEHLPVPDGGSLSPLLGLMQLSNETSSIPSRIVHAKVKEVLPSRVRHVVLRRDHCGAGVAHLAIVVDA